jgi:hypothetical protein
MDFVLHKFLFLSPCITNNDQKSELERNNSKNEFLSENEWPTPKEIKNRD